MIKNIDRWIGSYITENIKKAFVKTDVLKPIHVMFCCVDHYEPDWNNADIKTQMTRVQRWVDEYPKLAVKHKDSDGVYPQYTFFYPAEVYVKENLDLLSQLCRKGFGEVEIHLHHDNDTEEGLRQKLEKAKKDFSSHGYLGKRNLSGQIRFAFIHGNWSLNNSRRDGRWCGVNDEITILKDAGCYADFTYPSAPSETQPRKINSIYYAKSHRDKPKMHNQGKDACAGKRVDGDLLMIQGPLALNWRRRSKGIFPKIENGEISGSNHPTEDRVDIWVKTHICVKGRQDWIFVKAYAHGAPEKNAETLLGDPMDRMFSYLESKYNDGKDYILHYVTAREMYNIVKAAEAGEKGNPNMYRDYLIERNN